VLVLGEHLTQISRHDPLEGSMTLGNRPMSEPHDFFHDWRFPLVGLRWWPARIKGRA
jgi:hypothetical protein